MLTTQPWFRKNASEFKTLVLTKPEVEALKKILAREIPKAEAEVEKAKSNETRKYSSDYAEFLSHLGRKVGWQAKMENQATPEELADLA